jgi:hypothetical protein
MIMLLMLLITVPGAAKAVVTFEFQRNENIKRGKELIDLENNINRISEDYLKPLFLINKCKKLVILSLF